MLCREALESALPLTEVLDGAGLYLTAAEGTPLAALVKATRSDPLMNIRSEVNGYTPDLHNIEYLANVKDPVLLCSPHDVVMDEVIEVATKAVQAHLLFAKNVVAPAVQELVEKTATTLREMTPSALVGMEVVVWMPPKPMQNPSLETSARRYEEAVYEVPVLNMKMPAKTAAEIVAMMTTGTAGLDRDVAEWLSIKGDTWLLTLWENVFQQKQAELNQTTFKSFRDYVEDREDGLDQALAIFLLARRLSEEPIEGIEMPLPRFQESIVNFRNQAGARLCRGFDALDAAVKSGTLVRSADDKKTVVNGQVYRQWIEAGGDNEVLFGNLLDQPYVSTVANLDAKATALKARWQKHALLTATIEANRRFSRTKTILQKHFTAQLVEAGQGDPAIANNIANVLRMFNDQLDAVGDAEFADMYALCLRLVCRSRFVQTDAEVILSGIDRVKRENPQIDIREAAAVSLLEYVARWVASQFKVNAV